MKVFRNKIYLIVQLCFLSEIVLNYRRIMDESNYVDILNDLDGIYFSFFRKEKQVEKVTRKDLPAAVFQRLFQVMFIIDPTLLVQQSTQDFPTPFSSRNGCLIYQSYGETARRSLQREFLAGKVSVDCCKWVRENWEHIFF